MMDRRSFITMVGGSILAAPFAAEAQQAAKVARLGVLAVSAADFAPRIEAFRNGLREHGYVEGKNIVFEYRYAEGKLDRLPDLAAELVALKVDVIVTASTPAVQAAKKATSAIPIVFAAVGDPVAAGLVESLARPGQNVTVLSVRVAELDGKRLELLKEAVSKTNRVAVLFLSASSRILSESSRKEREIAAQALGIRLISLSVRDLGDIEAAFETLAAIVRERPSALLVTGDTVLQSHISQILAFAGNHRLPVVVQVRENAEAGALMSYAPNRLEGIRRAAVYIDKILRGAKPGDLPIEQPTKFELVIHLKTAKALGLTIPQSLLFQATEVIE